MNPARPRVSFVPILLLMSLHLVGLALVLQYPDGVWPFSEIGGRFRIASGLVHGEIAVIAAWGAWSQMTFALRVPLAMLGSFLAGFVLVILMDYGPAYVPIEIVVITLGAGLLQGLTILGMCQAARAFGIDWRNVRSRETPQRRRAQFHLWELLTLMAAIALFLGAFRMLWPDDAHFDWAKMPEDRLLLTSVLVVGNLLLANSVVTVYWIPRGWLMNLAITFGLSIVITLLEWLASQSLNLHRSIYMFGWMNGTFLGWLLMSLGLVRLAGYRLERVRFPKWSRLKGSGGVFAVRD